MKWISGLLFLFITSFSLSACSQDNNQTKLNEVQDNLNDKIASLQAQINTIQDQITNLSFTLYTLNNNEATFSPSSKGYETIKSDVGSLLISLNKLSKYANGYKVTMNIGNPNSMTLKGVTATIRWGKPYENNQNFQVWRNSLKVETIQINKSILPGLWNTVSFILSPATPSETGYISISLKTNEVYLYPDIRKQTS